MKQIGSILYGGLLKQCNFVAWGYSNALELFNIPMIEVCLLMKVPDTKNAVTFSIYGWPKKFLIYHTDALAG